MSWNFQCYTPRVQPTPWAVVWVSSTTLVPSYSFRTSPLPQVLGASKNLNKTWTRNEGYQSYSIAISKKQTQSQWVSMTGWSSLQIGVVFHSMAWRPQIAENHQQDDLHRIRFKRRTSHNHISAVLSGAALDALCKVLWPVCWAHVSCWTEGPNPYLRIFGAWCGSQHEHWPGKQGQVRSKAKAARAKPSLRGEPKRGGCLQCSCCQFPFQDFLGLGRARAV